MSNQVTGRVKRIYPTQLIGEKQYKKTEFSLIIDPSAQYPGLALFEAFGDKAHDAIGTLKEGEEITVDYDLKGREWEDIKNGGQVKTFNALSVWRVQRNAAPTSLAPSPTPAPNDDAPF